METSEGRGSGVDHRRDAALIPLIFAIVSATVVSRVPGLRLTLVVRKP
jgi:hypothetical protein